MRRLNMKWKDADSALEEMKRVEKEFQLMKKAIDWYPGHEYLFISDYDFVVFVRDNIGMVYTVEYDSQGKIFSSCLIENDH